MTVVDQTAHVYISCAYKASGELLTPNPKRTLKSTDEDAGWGGTGKQLSCSKRIQILKTWRTPPTWIRSKKWLKGLFLNGWLMKSTTEWKKKTNRKILTCHHRILRWWYPLYSPHNAPLPHATCKFTTDKFTNSLEISTHIATKLHPKCGSQMYYSIPVSTNVQTKLTDKGDQ